MMMSGVIIFVFIVYHLLHFTVEVRYVNFTGRSFVDFTDPEKRHDIFKMMIVGFNNVWVSTFYLLGIALLCFHLSHGVSSMFQSLGWKNQVSGPFLDKFARVVAGLIFLGYASIPLAILLGYGKEYLR
jgi:succinate dehydrogenase / fumarate reductase cytochrome b subunit